MKRAIIIAIAAALLVGIVAGFFIGKGMYNKPIVEKVTRDTVRVTDTIPHYYPQPVEQQVVKYVTKWFPVTSTDTLTKYVTVRDSVAVDIPITSRHYHANEYDAWVSGYDPSLDSIKVYRETEYITETIIQSKPPNNRGLDIVGGIDYNTAQQRYTPYAAGELMYKPSRLQFGITGGVMMNDSKAEPFVGIKGKFTIF